MGTGFTIDTPLHVARFGISSVISLVDDLLIDQMRLFHGEKIGEPQQAISQNEDDFRGRRITAYLNLVGKIVERQVEALQASPFEPGSDITKYFDLLPESPLKADYGQMLAETNPEKKATLQAQLRPQAVPGSIDVNIMTKLDRPLYSQGQPLPIENNDAMAALRGFAQSDLGSAIVLSAGMNQKLYSYMAQFEDFLPDAQGNIRKRIVLKVSDYRSALIQGKFLAKKGLWVSEFRVESGLNCGGHAFATPGHLMGPILEEFKINRAKLFDTLKTTYTKAINGADQAAINPRPARITVQGGIGTADEQTSLLKYYELDGTGWATPFLLVPEVSNVDEEHLAKLAAATENEVYLSDSSPMGVLFWNLRTSSSEESRRQNIADGNPGSTCPKGHVVTDTTFSDVPLCTSSRAYQRRRLEQLKGEDLTDEQRAFKEAIILAKSCVCHHLAGGALVKNGIDPDMKTCICCGDNIINFSKIATLSEMVSHIYGRISLLTNPDRQHMFVRELSIYVEHLRKDLATYSLKLSDKKPAYFMKFKENLLTGIEYYRKNAEKLVDEQCENFLREVEKLREQLEQITIQAG